MDWKPPSSLTVLRGAPARAGFLASFGDSLDLRRFHPPLPSHVSSTGWALVDDPSGEGFDETDRWHMAPWVVLLWRTDKKNVPPALVRLETDRLCREWMARHDRTKVPHDVKEELAEHVLRDLCARTPAAPSFVLVAWDTVRGDILVGTTNAGVVGNVIAAWELLTGDRPKLWRPGSVVAGLDVEALQVMTGTDAADLADSMVLRDSVASELLRWLWWRSESAGSELPSVQVGDQVVSWIAVDGLTIRDAESGKRRMGVRAADAAADVVVKAALVDGHGIESVGLRFSSDGVPMGSVSLQAAAGDVIAAKVTLPKLNPQPLDAAVEAAVLLQALHATIEAAVSAFAVWRGYPEQWEEEEHRYTAWVRRELADWIDEVGVLGDGEGAS